MSSSTCCRRPSGRDAMSFPIALLLLSVTTQHAAEPIPREELRYDDKDFNWWSRRARTELKTELRAEAFKALGVFGANGYADEATDILFNMMGTVDAGRGLEDDAALEKAAVAALKRMSPEVSKALHKEMQNDNVHRRRFAVWAVGKFPPQAESFNALLDSRKDEDVLVRKRIIGSMKIYGLQAPPAVASMIADENAEVRTEAVRALSSLPTHLDAFNALLDARKDNNAMVRSRIASSLVAYGRKAAAVIAPMAADESPDVRRNALWALNELKCDPHTFVPILSERLNDQDSRVRQTALDYLTPLVNRRMAKGAAPALIEAYRSTGDVQFLAVLSVMGPDAEEALPLLRELGQAEDQDLRNLAASAIRNIERQRVIDLQGRRGADVGRRRGVDNERRRAVP